MQTKRRGQRGQVLVLVLVILLVAAILVPLMVFYAQREALWTAKEAKTTTAFHLAEAGTEKGYLELSLSTATFTALQKGTLIAGFNFDQVYTDIAGGSYSVKIASGPGTQEATIYAVGRDSMQREVRALKVVYQNAAAGNMAIMGGSAIDVSGNNLTVEWGGIMSQSSITVNSNLHPSYWSASSIDLDSNGSTPPNCDQPNCWFWHDYDTNLPSFPQLDFSAYQSSATNTVGTPCSACSGFYVNGSCNGSCPDTGGHTYFVTGNWTNFTGPFVGNIIVLGNLTMPNGAGTGQTVTASLPQQAWKQYCDDWSFYRTNYDGGVTNPYVNACPGLSSSYLSDASISLSITPVINGLLYVGGTFTGPQGGGNQTLGYGVLMVKGNINLNSNSHAKWYYNPTTSSNMLTTNLVLSRQSWQDDAKCSWTGAYPTCAN